MNQQEASHIKQLGLDALKNPNPNLRKAALLELRRYDTPIISEVLERVIQKDRDKEVRDLAQNLLTKFKIQAAQQPQKASEGASSQAVSKASGGTWKCDFCGSETSDPQRCPNCGAERKDSQTPNAPKMKVNADTFLLNPAHRDYVLGKSTKLSRNSPFGTGCIMSFLSVFVLFGALFLVFTLRETYEWFMISQRGITGSAQYVDRRISLGDESDDYYVSFRYTHDGIEYTREQSVSWDVYNTAETGEKVQIVYVPTNPQLANVAGTNSAPTFMLLFAMVWNGVVALVIVFIVRQANRRKFLERNGKMLPGEVLESTHSTDSDGDLSLKVEYTFQIPDSNKRLSKIDRAMRNDLKGKRPPAPGTPIVILYYNEQHYMLL